MENPNNFKKIRQERKYAILETKVRMKHDKKGGVTYPLQDSNLDSFAYSFYSLVPKEYQKSGDLGKDFKSFIESILKKGSIAGEFGGIGYDLFTNSETGFSKDFFIKTLGVALANEKKRQPDLYGDPNKEKFKNHTVIEGDIFDRSIKNNSTKNEIIKWLNGEKFDLIIERLAGGQVDAPQSLGFQFKILQDWYQILNENGLIFIELPINLEKVKKEYFVKKYKSEDRYLLESWVKKINSEYSGTIEIKLVDDVMLIHKKYGAPKFLPKF